ncbi:hypothetical protein EK904_013473 [Melospiza melodia maxima]|nr:hypothetical protein EK904_013473 [Melospiza melodia maxima]
MRRVSTIPGGCPDIRTSKPWCKSCSFFFYLCESFSREPQKAQERKSWLWKQQEDGSSPKPSECQLRSKPCNNLVLQGTAER